MASNKRLITVFGATGNQGGSVVEALLKDGSFAVRGITRNPDSTQAKDLQKRGVEMVQADMVGPMEKVADAMKGSYGAFLVTNFWDPKQMQIEEDLGEKLVDAARQAGVKHIVWSTLPNVKKMSRGKYNVPHFTNKAEVEEYIRDLQSKSPKPFETVSFVAPTFYYQNFEYFMPPKKEGDTMVFTVPKSKSLTAFDVNEMGHSVVACLKNPMKYNLKRIDFYGENASPDHYTKTYARVTGKKARLDMLSEEEYVKTGVPAAEELAQMFSWFDEFTFYGGTGDPKSGQEVTPGGLSNYETYLRKKNPQSS
jgi:uncharacterized protein YbjT (DUF2867 family)